MKNLILLTAESTGIVDVFAWIMCIVVLTLMILYVRKERIEKGNKEALDKFLKDISDVVRKRIIEFIGNFDITTYKDDYMSLQADLINGIYDDIYVLSMSELENIMGSDSVTLALILHHN